MSDMALAATPASVRRRPEARFDAVGAPGSRLGRLGSRAVGLLVPLALLAAWQYATRAGLVTPMLLPPPARVLHALVDMARNGTLAGSLAVSLRRIAEGFLAGSAIGLLLGSLMGLSPRLDRLLRPLLLAIVQVPVLAWIPLLMIPLGIGEVLKIVVIGLAAFSPVLLNTIAGVRSVPAGLREVGRLYRLGLFRSLRGIVLPGAMLPIFTGLRLALTQAWFSLVAVELLASTNGIGYVAVMARQMFQLDVMLATALVIGLVGFAIDRSLRLAEAALAQALGGSLA